MPQEGDSIIWHSGYKPSSSFESKLFFDSILQTVSALQKPEQSARAQHSIKMYWYITFRMYNFPWHRSHKLHEQAHVTPACSFQESRRHSCTRIWPASLRRNYLEADCERRVGHFRGIISQTHGYVLPGLHSRLLAAPLKLHWSHAWNTKVCISDAIFTSSLT